jgi:hypothetical protein
MAATKLGEGGAWSIRVEKQMMAFSVIQQP